jgi:hypothetical protein
VQEDFMRKDLVRCFALLVVAAVLGGGALSGCMAEPVPSDPIDESQVAPAAPPADDAIGDDAIGDDAIGDDAAARSFSTMCGGQQCSLITHVCCHNHCARRVPGFICAFQGGDGASE